MANTCVKFPDLNSSIHLIRWSLLSDFGVDEVVQVGGEAFEGEMRVLGQYVCCQVIVVVFDVQQEKIGKRLCSNWWQKWARNGTWKGTDETVYSQPSEKYPPNKW